MEVLSTVHGSRLYGMAHSRSDNDTFRVVLQDIRTRARVDGEKDDVTVGLDTFLERVFSGSHQSVEALFSPVATVHPHYEDMFRNIRVTGADAFAKYRRTIKSFSYGGLKQKRHAVRLGFNLRDLRTCGRFDPQLKPQEVQTIRMIADLYSGQSLYDICVNM